MSNAHGSGRYQYSGDHIHVPPQAPQPPRHGFPDEPTARTSVTRKHKPSNRQVTAMIILVGVFFFAIGCAVGRSSVTTPPAQPRVTTAPSVAQSVAPPPAVVAPPAPPPAPTGPATSFGNGQAEVGTDVALGKYVSPGVAAGAPFCYLHVKQGRNYLEQSVVTEGQVRVTLTEEMRGAELDVSGCQGFTAAP